MGGKSRLVKRIVPQIPQHATYCEPFCGACWVLLGKDPDTSKCEIINDLDTELVTFWRVIQYHRDEFMRYYKYAVVSRKLWELENKKIDETLTDIQRAAKYFYLQKLAFGGKTTGRTFGMSQSRHPRLNLITLEDQLLELHARIQRVWIECKPASKCISDYDAADTFFFIDPPYYNTAGYTVPFCESDYISLRDQLRSIKGKFLLTFNDHPAIRTLFSEFVMEQVTLKYSLAKKAESRSVPRYELFIKNY